MVIEGKRALRHILVCLMLALACSVAAGPALRIDSSYAWAKDTKKTSKKKTSKKKNGFIKKNGRWYHYKDGKKQTGWFTVGKRIFYGCKKGNSVRKGSLLTGWQEIGKKEYYFRETGKKGKICSAAIGCTVKINGIAVVFDADGDMVKLKYAKAKPKGFVEVVGEMAREAQMKHNILASLIVAQACVETGIGGNIYHNNLFGIRQGTGYRSYESWQDSVDDYVDLITNNRYLSRVVGVMDAASACYIIGKSGYAEAGGYGDALYSMIQQENLTRFSK